MEGLNEKLLFFWFALIPRTEIDVELPKQMLQERPFFAIFLLVFDNEEIYQEFVRKQTWKRN